MVSREPSNIEPNVDLDSCGICLGDFKKPKILPCFHTFCLNCLKTYVDKTGRNEKFTCPLCLIETDLPPGGVERFQTNFYVKAEQAKALSLLNARCDVCDIDIPSKAENRCLECDQNLCQNCSRTHLKMTSSKEHHLMTVNFPEKPLTPAVMTKVFCDKHKTEELSFYCQVCDGPICLRCKVTSHENHSTKDLSDVAAETRQFLGVKLSEAKSFLPTVHEQLNEINRYEDHLTQSKQQIVKKINERATDLHSRIDKISNSMLNDIEAEFRVEMSRVDSQRRALGKAGKALSSQFHAANQVVYFGSDAEIARNKQVLSKRLEKLTKKSDGRVITKLDLAFFPSSSLEGKIEDIFGSLSTARPPVDDTKVTEVSVFQVDDTFKVVSSICPREDGEAWITSGWKPEIHLFSVQGTRLKTENAGRNIDTIVMSHDGSIVVSCSDKRQILKGRNGLDFSVIATVSTYPRGIAINNKDEVFVCTGQSLAFQDYKDGHRNKVLRYSLDGSLLGEFGDPSSEFLYPLRVVCNITGDVVVSDCQKRRITIHRQDGYIKFSYTGTETENLRSPFEPRGVTCDSRGFIYVTDNANDAVHLLDHTGKFVRLLLTTKDEIYGPYSVAIDSKNNLWVGCRDATVKIFHCAHF
ncbi:tripartite motif-containing protein 2-like [Saccostrea cucullata]|uniref:tripartite motif-containing protein 2-like n=1 Tax=Saccostrea cuccullata TaxID=36930 RepID=UPI002ED3C30E